MMIIFCPYCKADWAVLKMTRGELKAGKVVTSNDVKSLGPKELKDGDRCICWKCGAGILMSHQFLREADIWDEKKEYNIAADMVDIREEKEGDKLMRFFASSQHDPNSPWWKPSDE